MILTRNYLPLLSVSSVLVVVLLVHVDPSFAYSNRLLRFARNGITWRIPQNIYDLFKIKRYDGQHLKRAGIDSIGRNALLDYEDDPEEDVVDARPRRGSMRLRRLRREDADASERGSEEN